jgi:hypothetical protein
MRVERAGSSAWSSETSPVGGLYRMSVLRKAQNEVFLPFFAY